MKQGRPLSPKPVRLTWMAVARELWRDRIRLNGRRRLFHGVALAQRGRGV